jgi:hypothetical protein
MLDENAFFLLLSRAGNLEAALAARANHSNPEAERLSGVAQRLEASVIRPLRDLLTPGRARPSDGSAVEVEPSMEVDNASTAFAVAGSPGYPRVGIPVGAGKLTARSEAPSAHADATMVVSLRRHAWVEGVSVGATAGCGANGRFAAGTRSAPEFRRTYQAAVPKDGSPVDDLRVRPLGSPGRRKTRAVDSHATGGRHNAVRRRLAERED